MPNQEKTDIGTLLSRLANTKRSGQGWTARCPAHDDKLNSLGVDLSPEQHILLRCHAGCDFTEICSALGVEPSSLFADSIQPKATIDKIHEYNDAEGRLVYQKLRMWPKAEGCRFRHRPDAGSDWIWNMDGVSRPLYNLRAVLRAAAAGETIYYVEGEKDADRLKLEGKVATTAGGTGDWRREMASSFQGAQCLIIIADNDEKGIELARRVAIDATGFVPRVEILLPALQTEHADISDHLRAGYSLSDLRPLLEQTTVDTDEIEPPSTPEKEKKEKQGAAQKALELALEEAALFQTPQGHAWATIEMGGAQQNWPVEGSHFRRWLSMRFFERHGSGVSVAALKDAELTIAAHAYKLGDRHDVSLRVGQNGDGSQWIDLCNPAWSALRIDKAGWAHHERPGLKISRTDSMEELPIPLEPTAEHPGRLRPFLNISDEDYYLVMGFILQALRPTGPYPILILTGEQGTAKTTAARMIGKLVDPTTPQVQTRIRTTEDLWISASNGHLLTFDNQSKITQELSDALCGLSTGSGFRKRKLYTDNEEITFSGSRPMVMTSINDIATQGDLLSRAIPIELQPIKERRQEEELWASFYAERPYILGNVLTAYSRGLSQLSSVSIHDPAIRMADFARWGTACLGQRFLDAYTDAIKHRATDIALEGSVIVEALFAQVSHHRPFEGNSAELLDLLEDHFGDDKRRPTGWPRAPKTLANEIRTISPNLRNAGHEIDFRKSGSKRLIFFRPKP